MITAKSLRAPETIQRGLWDEKVDIWTFGCLIFEIVIGCDFFRYEKYEEHGLDEAAGHFYRLEPE